MKRPTHGTGLDRSRLAIVLACSLIIACGGDDDDDGGGATPGETVSATVGSGGGRVEATGGTTTGSSVDIPEGALDSDVEISIGPALRDVTEDATGFASAGPTVNFGPDGTTFSSPVTITVPYIATSLPADFAAEDLVILKRTGSGEISALMVTAVGTNPDTVSTQVTSFSDYQAAVPTSDSDADAGGDDTGGDDTGGEDADAGGEDTGGEDADAGDDDTGEEDTGPSTCESADDCADGEVCISGTCAPELAPADYDENLGYAFEVTIDGECCFDLDGDSEIDNQLGELVSLFNDRDDANVSIGELLEEQFQKGIYLALIQFGGLTDDYDGSVDLSFLLATNDTDSDGLPEHTIEEREAGDGIFQLLPGGLMPDVGSKLRMPMGTVEPGSVSGSGLVTAGPANFDIWAPVPRECPFRFHENDPFPPLNDPDAPESEWVRCRGESPHHLMIANAMMSGEITLTDGGVQSADDGLMFGGYVHLETLAQYMDTVLADECGNCSGFGVTPSEGTFLNTGVEGDAYILECVRMFTEEEIDTCSPAQATCNQINSLCGILPIFANMADADTDGDGVNDSFSFGLQMQLVEATLDDDMAVSDGGEDCGGDEDVDGDGLAGCEDPECWDNTNCGGLGHSEMCRNGIDDDGNGLTDCEDTGRCGDNRACMEDCTNGEDDNLDGETDCDDDLCADDAACDG